MHALPRACPRTLLGVVASLTLLITLLPAEASAESHNFRNYREVPNNACDVDTPPAAFGDRQSAAQTHRRSIDCVAQYGITGGRAGLYHPTERVTRDQMASFIARTLEAAGDRDLPAQPGDHFDDTDGNVHEHRIHQLAEIGVVQGRTDGTYGPRALVTRAQMASFLVRAAAWNHTGDTAGYQPTGEEQYFLDITPGPHFDAIRVGYELWLFEGRAPGAYDQNAAVRRDTMATFLTRVLDFVHPNIYETNNQTYVMSPMEALTAAPGEVHEFSVDRSRAAYVEGVELLPGPVSQALHLALFPCAGVDWQEDPATFADVNGDALADGLGQSDTGQAYISTVNGQPLQGQPGIVPGVTPVDGRIEFTVAASQPDCTVVVAFDDRAPADQLRLDAGQRPANAYGFVVGSWE